MFGRKIKRIEPIESDGDEDLDEAAEAGLSLEDLGNAYAKAANAQRDEQGTSIDGTEQLAVDRLLGTTQVDEEALLEAPSVAETDGLLVTTESVLESILFLGTSDNRPVDPDRLLGLFRNMTREELEESIDKLNRRYRSHDRTFEIVQDIGGYRMQLIPSMEIVRERFYGKVKETQLPQSAIDCLAIIAYQPGITREEVDKAWGQPAINTLNLLIRKGLLRADKSEGLLRYHTTDRFLELIGLQSIDDLPREEL